MSDEKEWSDLDKRELTILSRWFWSSVIVAVALFLWFAPGVSWAGPVYQADVDGVKIVLTDEECRLPAVANLKRRATWTEKGKVYEGCYGGHPTFPIVMAYFADKTVVVLPAELFTKVAGA